jgi:hypothetical protein
MAFTAITANWNTNVKRITNEDLATRSVIVKTGISFYKGGLAVFETGATGLVIPATNTASEPFAGIFAESGTGDSATYYKIYISGDHEMIKTTPAITDVGVEFYCDGGSSGADNKIQSGTSTGAKVGMCVRYEGTTSGNVVINIDNYCN